MEQVEVITIKVPTKLKKDMKQVDVNWSQYIRECIQKKIDQQRRITGSKMLDEIRQNTKPTSTEEIVAWIREDRER
jgi:hypothetical protein